MLRTRRACAVALLICVGGAGAVLPNYKVSTRLFTHSNDNGQDQAAMHVGDPGTRGFKDPATTEPSGIATGPSGKRSPSVISRMPAMYRPPVAAARS